MTYNASQERLYDTGLQTSKVLLHLMIADLDIWLSHEADPNYPVSFGAPIVDRPIPATPCITSISEVEAGFDQMNPGGDQVTSMIVQALNVRLPIYTQNPVVPFPMSEGRLSDYLAEHCLGGPDGSFYEFIPGFAFLYLTGWPAYEDTYTNHYYLFRGMIRDFEVTGDSQMVTIRLTEDLRWDRKHPYPISRKNFLSCPQDSIGEHIPLSFGNFAHFAHKDFPKDNLQDVTKGPFDMNSPMFPTAMNLAPTVKVQEYLNPDDTHRDSNWLVCNGGPAEMCVNSIANSYNHCLLVPYGADFVAMIKNSVDFTNYDGSFCNDYSLSPGGQTNMDSPAGRHDLQIYHTFSLQDKYIGTAQILPLKRVTTSVSITDNLATIFNPYHRQRGPLALIDGDRYSWFLDDDTTHNFARLVAFELGGVYPNLGAVSKVQLVVAARRMSGSGTLSVTGFIDWQDGSSTSSSSVILNTFANGYSHGAGNFANILSLASQVERWEFMQHNVNPHKPMKLGIAWVKSNVTDTWRIYQIALKVEFNPHKKFLEYKTRKSWRTIKITHASGRNYDHTIEDVWLDKVYGAVDAEPLQRAFYAGATYGGTLTTQGDELYPGQPTTQWRAWQNPSDIIRQILLEHAGRTRDDAPAGWPPIKTEEIIYNATVPLSGRDFKRTKDEMDLAVQEAAAPGSTETFKLGVSFPTWPGVREVVRGILAATPGLSFFRIPQDAPLDTSRLRGALCLSWPQTGADVDYRRAIHLRTDAHSFNWAMTPRHIVANDIRLRYGYSTVKGNYCRELWASNDLFEHGMPFNSRNNSSPTTAHDSEASDFMATPMGSIIGESTERYGHMDYQAELPFVFRWHEALAIRNYILRWYAFQRVRVNMVLKMTVGDLLPGDVFQFTSDADKWIDCQFPLRQLPITSFSWASASWLVERVGYMVGPRGDVAIRVQAICNDRMGEA